MTIEQIANPLNSYGNYGVLHNEALNYFWLNRTYFGTSYGDYKSDAFSVVADFYANANPDNISGSEAKIKGYYKELQHIGYNYAAYSMFVSQEAKDMSANLFNNSIINYSGSFLPDSIAPIINNVKNWEENLNDVLQSSEAVPPSDVKMLWLQSSILRYSSWYWANDNANPNEIIKGDSQNLKGIEVPFDDDGKPTDPPLMYGF